MEAKKYANLSPECFEKDKNIIRANFKPFIEANFLLSFILGLIKPVSRGNKCYYDEREWRLFYPDNAHKQFDWKWGISKKEFELNKISWNNKLNSSKDFFIQISEQDVDKYITHIIVRKEDDVDKMIRFILENDKLFGCDWKDKYSRYKLISKVMSMERIEGDF